MISLGRNKWISPPGQIEQEEEKQLGPGICHAECGTTWWKITVSVRFRMCTKSHAHPNPSKIIQMVKMVGHRKGWFSSLWTNGANENLESRVWLSLCPKESTDFAFDGRVCVRGPQRANAIHRHAHVFIQWRGFELKDKPGLFFLRCPPTTKKKLSEILLSKSLFLVGQLPIGLGRGGSNECLATSQLLTGERWGQWHSPWAFQAWRKTLARQAQMPQGHPLHKKTRAPLTPP